MNAIKCRINDALGRLCIIFFIIINIGLYASACRQIDPIEIR